MIPSNPNQIPVIQSSSQELVQVQLNINRILRNLNNKIMNINDLITNGSNVGEVRFSSMNITQFQLSTSTDWVLADGQNCIGTKYANLTKNNTVPSISVSGVNAFIKVN